MDLKRRFNKMVFEENKTTKLKIEIDRILSNHFQQMTDK